MSSFTEAFAGALMRGIFESGHKEERKMSNVGMEKKVVARTPEWPTPMELAIEALRAIHVLKEDKKLRSWRGKEAVRLAGEALSKLGKL